MESDSQLICESKPKYGNTLSEKNQIYLSAFRVTKTDKMIYIQLLGLNSNNRANGKISRKNLSIFMCNSQIQNRLLCCDVTGTAAATTTTIRQNSYQRVRCTAI